uniref:BTB domain-containing protein n=1 Tax=Craspedostauros australis TaxID=1486917 RepID=A0A7R9ZPE7_9STRA
MSRITNGGVLDAAGTGDLNTISMWEQQNPKVSISSIKDRQQNTVLHLACSEGRLGVVKYLVGSCKANVNARNNAGFTPLHQACSLGHFAIVKYLTESSKADVNIRNSDGHTALHFASSDGHYGIVQYLIESCNTNVNAQDLGGATSLHLACQYNHFDIARYLVESGHANVNVQDADGNTPLHSVCSEANVEMVKFLLGSSSTDVTIQNKYGQTPWEFAKAEECDEVARYFSIHLQTLLAQNHHGLKSNADIFNDFLETRQTNINRDRLKALESKMMSDVIFLVGTGASQRSIEANGAIMLATVPSIKAMILSAISDEEAAGSSLHDTDRTTIALPHFDPSHVECVLKYIYAGDASFIHNSTIAQQGDLQQLLVVADHFGVWKLKLIIEALLTTQYLSKDVLVETLLFADAHGCLLLKDAAVRLASKDVAALMDHPRFSELFGHAELMEEITRHRQGEAPNDGIDDEFSEMSMMSLYKMVDEHSGVGVDSYMDRPSLLRFIRSTMSESTVKEAWS